MFVYIVLSLSLILSVLGLTEIIHGIWLFLIRPHNISEGEYIVVLNKEMPYEQYRYFIEKYRWEISSFAEQLIFLYEDKIPEILKTEVNKYENVKFIELDSYYRR